MAPSTSTPPAMVSAPRIATLLTSLLVSLSSGTNYVYSAYAPQLGSRLHITHTQLNIIAAAGNVGVYSTGPLWGKVVDARGPRLLLASAFVLLLAGYSGIRHIYDVGVPDSDGSSVTLSTFSFCLLILYGYMTGAGSNGGLASSVNATAKSFPDKARATTTGLVLSGFGLSALVFSTVAHIAYPGDTSSFLLLLSLGTSLPMILGFFLVRPIPLPESAHSTEEGIVDGYHHTARPSTESPIVFERDVGSHTSLLGRDGAPNDAPALLHPHLASQASSYVVPQIGNAVELSPTRSISSSPANRHRPRSAVRPSFGSAARVLDSGPNIHGKQILMSKDFWLLFTIMSLLSGTGLMWINNVGSISQALFAKGNPSYDRAVSARWQATQVSTVSFTNFLGRILIGLLSDYTKNKLHVPRSYCVSLVSFLFIVSQVIAASVQDVHDLWKASAVLGLAYGTLFGLFPAVSIDSFGLAHLSENWGFLSVSPLIGGNLFSIAFGRNLDAHASPEPITGASPTGVSTTLSSLTRRAGLPSGSQCFDGRECYVASLNMTVVACGLALALSVWTGWRDRQKAALKGPVMEEVIWEEEEEE